MIEALATYGVFMPRPTDRTGLSSAALAVFLGLVGPVATVGQETGSVTGAIYDSVSARPLVGAEVYVWRTSIRTRTDELGEFTLASVPAGEQRIVFAHDLLFELGVSTGNTPVEVLPDQESRVELATPSAFTILRNTCLLEGGSPGSAVVVGYVGDDDSGVALPGARVHLTWLDELGSPHAVEAISDPRGWFRFCNAPTGVTLGATARFLNRSAARRQLSLAPGGEEWVQFQVADLTPGTLTGHLVDQDRNWGVEDAVVTLAGTQLSTVSGDDGKFRFSSVPPGEYTMQVSHIAYGERTDLVSVGDEMAVNVTVGMSLEPIALDPIEVSVESIVDMDGIVAGGTMVSREEVEAVRHRARDLADILRMQHMKDVIVRRGQTGELCVGISTGQVRMFRNDCTSAIFYVDNARVASPDMVVNMSAADIDRVVVYRPVEAGNLFGFGAGNGVIVVYTRSGQRRR